MTAGSSIEATDAAAMAAVECRKLTRFFGSFPALREVSVSIAQRKIIALYGGNGAGKSTLLRILAAALRPSSGSVSIFGSPANSTAAKRATGLLSHETFYQPTLTVGENLDYYATLYGVAATSAASEALALVNGEHLEHRRVAELSQGMKQKSALARALLHRPRLLLLDEPFASLDRMTVEELRATLAGLRERGVTMLVSTHTEALISDLADARLRLERGRVAEFDA